MATSPVEACEAKVDDVARPRGVALSVPGRMQAEGVGAKVLRSIGNPTVRNFDPFLMLDIFQSHNDGSVGFPDHPHRGFETVTLILAGESKHEDFCGNAGTLRPGDLQWMTAGRGIVHSEIPEKGFSKGLQLWVNLKEEDKMVEPAYQELKAAEIPSPEVDGVKVYVIAGTAFGISSPVRTRTPTMYLRVEMEAGKVLNQPVPAGWNAFLVTMDGQITIGAEGKGVVGDKHETVFFTNGDDEDGVRIETKDKAAHFVLIAGEPIGEPIVQHGPFVMTSREGIMQAILDYQSNSNGFERARKWTSKIAREAGFL